MVSEAASVAISDPVVVYSTHQQAANLLCAQTNLDTYPSAGWEIILVAYRLTGYGSEGLVWLIGAVICLLAAPHVQLFISTGKWMNA